MKKRIILGSESPRRREILSKTNLKFEIVTSPYEEDMTLDYPPKELVHFLAKAKAQALIKDFPDSIILTADTIVVHKNEVFGKPKTETRAIEMLQTLNNDIHSVLTGFCIIDTGTGKEISDVEESVVFFKNSSLKTIENYVQTKEPLDNAGAYAIQFQGKKFIEKTEGDYLNIVGLPLDAIIKILNDEFGVKIHRIDI